MSYTNFITPEQAKANTQESRKRDKEYIKKKLKEEDSLWEKLEEAIRDASSNRQDYCRVRISLASFAKRYKVDEGQSEDCLCQLVEEKGFNCYIDDSPTLNIDTTFVVSWNAY